MPSDDFDGGESDFATAEPVSYDAPGGAAFDEDTGPSFEDTLPTSIRGGVDQLYKSQQRQMASLRKSAMRQPVWQVNGQLTPIQPRREDFNWYHPIGGDPELVGDDVSFESVQEKMAKDLETQYPHMPDGKPLFTDEGVYTNRMQIFQSILDGADGNLNAESYFNNPHWDRIREAGATDEMVRALQKTTLSAIQPLYKQYEAIKGYKEDYAQFTKDPLAQQFIPVEVAPMLEHPDPRHMKVMQKLLKGAQDKAELLRSDPMMASEFEDMRSSQDRDGQMDYQAALLAKGAPQLLSVLKRYEVRGEKTAALKEKLNESIESQMEGIPGELAASVKASLKEMVSRGGIKDEGNLSRLLRSMKDESGVFDWNGHKLFGIHSQVVEGKMVKAIKDAMVDHRDKDLFIDSERKVHTETDVDMDKLVESDVRLRFGDWRIKSHNPGDMVQLPEDKFVGPDGVKTFLKVPVTQQDGTESYIPGSQVYGNVQYVDRKLLAKLTKNLGVTEKQMNDPEHSIELPTGFEQWRTQESLAYKPGIISAKDFMSLPEGERLRASGIMLQAQDQIQKRIKLFTNDAILNDPQPKKPGTWGAIFSPVKGFAAGLAGAGGGTVEAIRNIHERMTDNIADLVGTAFFAGRDPAQAKAFWDHLGNHGALPTIMQSAAQGDKNAIEAWGLDLNDGVGSKERFAYMIGNIVGRSAEMGGEMAMGGRGVGIPKIAEYLAEVTRFSKTAASIASKIPATTEDIRQARAIRAAVFAQQMIQLPMELAAWDAVHGQTDPKRYALDILSGILGAGATQMGRGIRLPWQPRVGGQPKYPDALRLTASTLAAAGTFGMDAVLQMHEGKTSDEILESLKDPQQITQLSIMAIQSAFGQHASPVINGGAPMASSKAPVDPKLAPETGIKENLKAATKQELTQRLLSGIKGDVKLATGEIDAIREALKKPNENLPDEIKKNDADLSAKIAVATEKMSPNEAKALVESTQEEAPRAEPVAAEGKPRVAEQSDLALATPEATKVAEVPKAEEVKTDIPTANKFLEAPLETQAAALIKYSESTKGITVTAEEKAALRREKGWEFVQKRGQLQPFEEIQPGKWEVKAQLFERPKTRDSVVVDAATEQEARVKAAEIFDERHVKKDVPIEEETLGSGERTPYDEMHEKEVQELVAKMPPGLKRMQPVDVVGIMSGDKGSSDKLKAMLNYFKSRGLEGDEAVGATMDALHDIDNVVRTKIREDLLAGVENPDFKAYEKSTNPEHQEWVEKLRDEAEILKDDVAEADIVKEIEDVQETKRQAGC